MNSSTSNDGTARYACNAASQLTGETNSYQTNQTHAYDATGNRTNPGYSTGANNELLSDGT